MGNPGAGDGKGTGKGKGKGRERRKKHETLTGHGRKSEKRRKERTEKNRGGVESVREGKRGVGVLGKVGTREGSWSAEVSEGRDGREEKPRRRWPN